ncbi:MAG: OmpA family protein [Thermodesulfobacteriota bacterium]|nr:OmpA family protein [Thermodesulfobacteriota bacterium]
MAMTFITEQKKTFVLSAIVFFSLVISISLCPAGNHNFESTSEGMLRALTAGREKGENGAGLSEMNKRKIATVRHLSNRPKHIHADVIASDNSRMQSVNLNIKFDFDSHVIRPESYALLDELGVALTDSRLRGRKILIIGHTDSDGPTLYNHRLSLRRSQSVKSYLTANFKMQAARIEVKGLGESSPLVVNINDINKQINRRVEIAILN